MYNPFILSLPSPPFLSFPPLTLTFPLSKSLPPLLALSSIFFFFLSFIFFFFLLLRLIVFLFFYSIFLSISLYNLDFYGFCLSTWFHILTVELIVTVVMGREREREGKGKISYVVVLCDENRPMY